jgi:DNA polymerase-3 subunit epsilon
MPRQGGRDMNARRRLLLAGAVAMVLAGLFVASWVALAIALLGAALDEPARVAVQQSLAPHGPLLVLLALLAALAIGLIAVALYKAWVMPLARLAEQAQAQFSSDAPSAQPAGPAALHALARTLDAFARQRQVLHANVEQQVRDSSRQIDRERRRLAALMGELGQAVVVCNLGGRVLLYNASAERLLGAPVGAAPGTGTGKGTLGLGRSIHALFDREPLLHALQRVRQQAARGVAQPSALCVVQTAHAHLLRVQLAPVRPPVDEEGGADAGSEDDDGLAGFVLVLEDLAPLFQRHSRQDTALRRHGEAARAALRPVRQAVDAMDRAQAESLRAAVAAADGELQQLQRQLERQLVAVSSARWPLEATGAADWLADVAPAIEQHSGMGIVVETVDSSLWVQLDSHPLMQSLCRLATRLHEEQGVRTLRLGLHRDDGEDRHDTVDEHAILELVWPATPLSAETVIGWTLDDIGGAATATARGGVPSVPSVPSVGHVASVSLREVARRHGSEWSFLRDRAGLTARLRLALPRCPAPAASEPTGSAAQAAAHPARFDFALLGARDPTDALDDRRLSKLDFTVFDTETTGLDPSGGDRIIQLAGVRVLQGRVLHDEVFDRLVDPRRAIPSASTAIHGITAAHVAGQPGIESVLPAFAAFAHDTVLVAHNAAFDMRFLQLQEQASGVRFEQPVLDTMVLSACVHPNQPSHGLEAIAERLGVAVRARHTALGDARVTADVFVKMLPLLAAAGIHTLADAQRAERANALARLSY